MTYLVLLFCFCFCFGRFCCTVMFLFCTVLLHSITSASCRKNQYIHRARLCEPLKTGVVQGQSYRYCNAPFSEGEAPKFLSPMFLIPKRLEKTLKINIFKDFSSSFSNPSAQGRIWETWGWETLGLRLQTYYLHRSAISKDPRRCQAGKPCCTRSQGRGLGNNGYMGPQSEVAKHPPPTPRCSQQYTQRHAMYVSTCGMCIHMIYAYHIYNQHMVYELRLYYI